MGTKHNLRISRRGGGRRPRAHARVAATARRRAATAARQRRTSRPEPRLPRRPHRRRRCARPEHGRRHQARARRVQHGQRRLQGRPCKVFDSQGDPDKATPLATQIVGDDSIVGLVGPGFSGESLATGKTFCGRRSAVDLPVGHQRHHHPAGLDHLAPRHRQRRRAGRRGRLVPPRHGRSRRRSSSSTTAPTTARAWPATSRTGSARRADRRHRHGPDRSDRLLRRRSPRSRLAVPTRSSTAATTPRPVCWSSSCGRPASRACSCPVTARRTRRSSRPPVRRPPNGAILTAPAGPAPADFDSKYKSVNSALGSVLDAGLRRGEHLPGRARRREDEPRGHQHVHRLPTPATASAVRSRSTRTATSRSR